MRIISLIQVVFNISNQSDKIKQKYLGVREVEQGGKIPNAKKKHSGATGRQHSLSNPALIVLLLISEQ
jgi:hypothetical protein